jgi:hypothetical protein
VRMPVGLKNDGPTFTRMTGKYWSRRLVGTFKPTLMNS